jgi:hypothetical protein
VDAPDETLGLSEYRDPATKSGGCEASEEKGVLAPVIDLSLVVSSISQAGFTGLET